MPRWAARRRRSSGLHEPRAFRRSRRPVLSALIDEDDMAIRTIAVDVVTKTPQRLRVADGLFPLALVRVDHTLHIGFEFGADAEPILAYHSLEIFQASFESVAPYGRALQTIGGANVEHQEAVYVADQRRLIEIGCQELSVARLHAAVAADIKIPAFFGGNHAHILALRLRALARATGYRELEFVGRAQTFVSMLDFQSETHTVLHSVAAPGRSHAAFDRAHRFALGVARFE